jgi:hypothetical protein
MDACPGEFGIHGEFRTKNNTSSMACHGCQESSISGIHGGIYEEGGAAFSQ